MNALIAPEAIYPSLVGCRVLVTGGGSGIGAAIVETFLRQRSRVTFFDIDDTVSTALVDRLGVGPEQLLYRHCDLSNVEMIGAAMDAVLADYGKIDVLVNNAGNDDRHTVGSVSNKYWDKCVAVNLRHYFFVTQAAVPAMQQMGGGVIINVGSISWRVGLTDLSVYQTANAGIEGLTRGLAREFGKDNIRVNTVVPGAIKTPRQDALWHDDQATAHILDRQCLKARVMPDDVAALVVFVASDSARMCTGQNFVVDAGWS